MTEEQKKSRYTEAQAKSAKKYLSTLDEVRIRMPKGRKEEIQNAAAAVGESMNQYVLSAIDRRMESGT